MTVLTALLYIVHEPVLMESGMRRFPHFGFSRVLDCTVQFRTYVVQYSSYCTNYIKVCSGTWDLANLNYHTQYKFRNLSLYQVVVYCDVRAFAYRRFDVQFP